MTSPSCKMKRNDLLYTGCGFVYQTKTDRDTQCGSGGTLQFIPASNSSCVIKRGQTLYTGCGFIYQSKTDRDTQCGSGSTMKFIPSSIPIKPIPSKPSPSQPSQMANPNIDAFGFPKGIFNMKGGFPKPTILKNVIKKNKIHIPTLIPTSNIHYSKIILWIGIVILILIILGMLYMSGYIAWNEFINDPTWLKVSKTYIAVLFAPIYLFYIFSKTIVLNIPR